MTTPSNLFPENKCHNCVGYSFRERQYVIYPVRAKMNNWLIPCDKTICCILILPSCDNSHIVFPQVNNSTKHFVVHVFFQDVINNLYVVFPKVNNWLYHVTKQSLLSTYCPMREQVNNKRLWASMQQNKRL